MTPDLESHEKKTNDMEQQEQWVRRLTDWVGDADNVRRRVSSEVTQPLPRWD